MLSSSSVTLPSVAFTMALGDTDSTPLPAIAVTDPFIAVTLPMVRPEFDALTPKAVPAVPEVAPEIEDCWTLTALVALVKVMAEPLS